MKTVKAFASAAMAGLCIGLGGLVYLAVEDRVIGSALFTVGLFAICSFGLNLFTGKVCYLPENDGAYALLLPVIWLGNFAGTGAAALAGHGGLPGLDRRAAVRGGEKRLEKPKSIWRLGLCFPDEAGP